MALVHFLFRLTDGAVAPEPPPPPPPDAGTVSGGGFGGREVQISARIDYRERKRIAAEVRTLYEAVRAEAKPDSIAAEEAATLVADYAPAKAPDLPPADMIDWALLAEEQARVENLAAMLATLTDILARIRRERDEDEDITLLMLAL